MLPSEYIIMHMKVIDRLNCCFFLQEAFSNATVWSHHLTVIIPDDIRIQDQAFIFISVGMNYHE